MKEFLFRKPPDVLAIFITLPILIHLICINGFEQDPNVFIILIMLLESIIMFHIYTLIRELDPDNIYLDESREKPIHVNTDYDIDDIELVHLENWYKLAHSLGIDDYKDAFGKMMKDYFSRQRSN